MVREVDEDLSDRWPFLRFILPDLLLSKLESSEDELLVLVLVLLLELLLLQLSLIRGVGRVELSLVVGFDGGNFLEPAMVGAR